MLINKVQFYFIADFYNQNFQEKIQRINELPDDEYNEVRQILFFTDIECYSF